MIQDIRRLLSLGGTVNASRYFLTGIALVLVKYPLDWTAAACLNRAWSPLSYLLWPDDGSLSLFELPAADRRFALVLLGIALPFIWVGVTLTLQRLRDAQLPLWLVVLFFIPVVNLLFILTLCLAPTAPPKTAPGRMRATFSRAVQRNVSGQGDTAAFLIACVVSIAVTVLLVVAAANILQSYGFGLFVGAPFFQGWLAAIVYGIPLQRSVKQCVGVAMAALGMSGLALLVFGVEGLICMLMAVPIALPLSALGGFVGYAVQSRPWTNQRTPAMSLLLLAVTPALMAAESMAPAETPLREVRTEVIVNASPERVWEFIISFPPLPEPSDWLFRAGIAYPQRAEMEGRGVGAVRRCVFSTGAFLEPIEVWDAPRRLAFRVGEQPPPMKELSPFHIHPPHLDNFLVSRRGQFLLERLPDGRTRLEGTTWYTNRMWPAAYWHMWADAVIHQIHRRVLEHVRGVAEADDRPGGL